MDNNVYLTERAIYRPRDFVTWLADDDLFITPKFQRRPVWSVPARSSFIDTMLRGMTVPPIYMRWAKHPTKDKKVLEVVDGQQRVRAVLEYMAPDGYRLSRTLKAPWSGKTFAQLPAEQQEQIRLFGLPTETFKGISDSEILEVFCRLNKYGVPLNKQELRNGRYFGMFKQTCYAMAYKYLEFWRTHGIFTERSIARMLEVELTSELLIAGRAGMQDKKKSIDDFYEALEAEYPHQQRDIDRFDETMRVISDTVSTGDLAESEFRRAPLFYTLYCVVYHHLYGLPAVQRPTPKKKLGHDEQTALEDAIAKLSDIVGQYRDPEGRDDIPRKYVAFVSACLRQTDNIKPRKMRFNTLYAEAF